METLPASNLKVEEILQRLLTSSEFGRSDQLKRILAYVCQASVDGREAEVTESSIAEEVLNRRNFDPNADTIVRVQMRRLRQKLDEYYSKAGSEEPVRLEFPRHSYVPVFKMAWRKESRWRRWTRMPPGFWYGFAAASALAGLWLAFAPRSAPRRAAPRPISRDVLHSPFWSGFAGRADRPLIAISTPLFFRSSEGLVRNTRINFAEDLPLQQDLLPKGFALPLWDSWVNIHNIQAALRAQEVFSALETDPIIESARHVSLQKLRGRAVLVLGHPRGAASLVDLLSSLNFFVRRSSSGESLDGFTNRSPLANELPHYQRSGGEAIHSLNLSGSDYGLITLIRDNDGSHILSLFGDYCDTPYYLVQRLTEPDFVRRLEERVFGSSIPDFEYCQIVFKVQFLNSEPIDAEFVTHRLVYRNAAQLQTKAVTSRDIHSFLLPAAPVSSIP